MGAMAAGARTMSESWKRWEGQIVNGALPLVRYLGGSDHSAVFLTERVGGAPQKTAIKLVPSDFGVEQQLLCWTHAAKLAHPNLIRIFESGRCELQGTALLYVVMELAEEDLGQIIPERALTPDESRAMLPTVLRALGHIHSQDLVHGRIRPSNILAAGDQVKLSSDTLRPAGESLPRSGSATIYAAPECASGEVAAPSDIWSLGVTLAEILTQRQPQWDRAPESIPKLPEGLSQPFDEIVAGCLVLDPRQRWSIAQIGERLQPQKTSVNRTLPQPRAVLGRERKLVAWPYMLAIIVIALLGWALMSRTKATNPNPVVQPKVEQKPAAASPVAEQAQTRVPKPNPATHAKTPSPESGSVAARGAVLQRVMPRVAPGARETIEGTIRVRIRVRVDPVGNVTDAFLESSGPSKYFARLALDAAREWKFTPPHEQGRAVASEWRLQFGFRRTDTEVLPSQVSP